MGHAVWRLGPWGSIHSFNWSVILVTCLVVGGVYWLVGWLLCWGLRSDAGGGPWELFQDFSNCHLMDSWIWWGMSLHQLGLRIHWSGPLCCNSIMVVSVSLLNPYKAQRIATWLNGIWNLGLVSMTWQGLVSVSTWCQLSWPEGTGFTILFELNNFLVLQFGLCMCWRLIGSGSRQWFINSCMVTDTWIIRPGYLHIAYPSCPYSLYHIPHPVASHTDTKFQ